MSDKIYLNGTRGFGKYAMVDEGDFDKLSKCKWRLSDSNYAVTYVYNKDIKRQKMIFMHRMIMSVPKGYNVDHINQDKLDNRKINLRQCLPWQNNVNVTRDKHHAIHTARGVYFDKEYKRYKAYINHDNKRHYLGSFLKESDAAKAYNTAAVKYHGEFAILNSIEVDAK